MHCASLLCLVIGHKKKGTEPPWRSGFGAEDSFGLNPHISSAVSLVADAYGIAAIFQNCIDVELIVDNLLGLEVSH